MIEAEGLDSLIADLRTAPGKVHAATRGIVEKGALNIKNEAANNISGLAHAPHYPGSITYDVKLSIRGDVEAEIGPDKNRRQGALGNILEYGTVNNPPLAHMGPALDREGPNFAKALMEVVGRAF